MQTVIVSGGLGTRVKHLLGEKPKSLADINGDSFLLLQLYWLKNNSSNLHFCLGFKAKEIIKELNRNEISQHFRTTFEIEPQPLGVIGALTNSIRSLESIFGVLLGDVIPNVNFNFLYEKAEKIISEGKSVMFIASPNSSPGQKGNVLIENNQIVKYSKKLNFSGSHVDIGFWFLQKEHLIKFKNVNQEEEFFNNLIENNLLSCVEIPNNSWEVGSEEGLLDIINNKDEIIYSLIN